MVSLWELSLAFYQPNVPPLVSDATCLVVLIAFWSWCEWIDFRFMRFRITLSSISIRLSLHKKVCVGRNYAVVFRPRKTLLKDGFGCNRYLVVWWVYCNLMFQLFTIHWLFEVAKMRLGCSESHHSFKKPDATTGAWRKYRQVEQTNVVGDSYLETFLAYSERLGPLVTLWFFSYRSWHKVSRE